MTVVYQLARQHEARGGNTTVIIKDGTLNDYPAGQCVVVDAETSNIFARHRVVADAVLGHIGLPRLHVTRAYSAFVDAVPKNQVGPVFVHNAPGPLPLFAKSRPSAAICLYAHNNLFRTYSKSEMRRSLRSASHIISVSQFIADGIISKLGIADGRVRVVPNGVDIDTFRPAMEQRQEGDPIILFLGRVSPEKGPDLLLRAALNLHSAGHHFRVRVVGSQGFSGTQPLSTYEQELRRLAEPLGDRVEFRPSVDRTQVLSEYQQAAIFCVPSIWDDPSPLVIPEALACGLPTVASRRGGIPELGGDAIAFLDTPSVTELTDILRWLLTDERARSQLALKARTRSELLSWSKRYEELNRALDR
jgi:glycosyltransferase involved in cell wall biosynthesis